MISYVELNPPISLTKTTTTWETFDLSANIPAGATFAVVRIENTTSTGRRFGYRAVGDTAPQSVSISGALNGRMYRIYYMPLSASRQLEIDISSTSVTIQVLAYLNGNATKVNYANITIPTANVWQTVDMSAYVTSTEAPKAAIILLNDSQVGFSPYGSSANLFNSTASQTKQTFVIPLSTEYTFKVYSTTTTANVVNIIGTINKGFIKYVEPIDKTPGSLSTWTPLSAPSNTATAGLYTVLDLGSGSDAYGLRKGGNTTNQTGRLYRIESAIISANSAGVVEANVTNSNYRVYEMGYFANIESQITSATTPVLATVTGITLNGLELITSNSARIKTGTKSIALDSFSSTDWNISFAVPSITNFISSNVAIGPVTLEVLNSSNAIVLSTPAIVEPPDQYDLHIVTSTASSANIGSIYYGQISPISINDVFLYDSATANYVWNFDITSNGYMIFDSGGSTLSDSVSYRVYSSTSETWNHMQYINLASPYINARTDSSRVATSADGNRYSKYPDGNIMAQTSMQSSISQYGITWTFDAAYPVGQYVTGDYFVVGSPTITTIIPAMTEDDANGTNRRNGSRKNPAPEEYTAWDSRTSNFTTGGANTTNIDKVPITLIPGDSLISTISKTANTVIDVSGHATTQVFLTDSAVLTCVSSVPFVDSFRPAYVSVSGKANFRASQIDSSWLNVLYPVGGEPSLSEIASRFARPWTASHIRDFVGRGSQPSNNMSSYYEYVAYDYGLAMLLMLTNTSANKTSLINGFVQESIDHYYCTKDHEANSSTNKAPILFAAKLLGATDWIANISSGAMTHPWREDTQTYYWADKQSANSSSIVTAGQVWTGYTPPVFWRQDPGNNEHEHLHPSEWNVVANGGGDKREDYRWSSVSQTWPALYLPLLISNLDGDFGHLPWAEYVDRWMTENMITQEAIIQSYYPSFNGVYKTSGYVWIDLMWSTYRGNY